MLRSSVFRIPKDMNRWRQRVLRLHCDFFQGQVTQIIFHIEKGVRKNTGMQVMSQGSGESSHTGVPGGWPHRLFPEFSPFSEFTSERKPS